MLNNISKLKLRWYVWYYIAQTNRYSVEVLKDIWHLPIVIKS